MMKRGSGRSGLVFPVATALGFPVVIISGKLIVGGALPAQALAVMFGAYAMGLVWAALGMTLAEEGAGTDYATASARSAEPGLELLYTVPVPPIPCTVAVMSAVGVCPRGMKVGDRLDVAFDGRLSSPLCRTAGYALGPLLMKVSEGENGDTQTCCQCPLAGRQLTFAARPASPIMMN